MPTAVATVTDAILAIWQAIPALANVTFVTDGFGENSRAATSIVLVGNNGDPDDQSTTEWQHVWVDMARTRQQEIGQIPCCVVSQNGTTNQPMVQTQAVNIVDACLAPFILDMTLGGVVFTAEVLTGTARTIVNAQGTAVIIPFTVNYWAQV